MYVNDLLSVPILLNSCSLCLNSHVSCHQLLNVTFLHISTMHLPCLSGSLPLLSKADNPDWSHLLVIVIAASLIQQALNSCINHAKALNVALVLSRHLIDVQV